MFSELPTARQKQALRGAMQAKHPDRDRAIRRAKQHDWFLALLPAICSAVLGIGTPAAKARTSDETRLLAALKKVHPGTQFSQVLRSPLAGVYEVWMNSNVAFVSAKEPRYFIFGRMFDAQTMRDLTGPKLALATQDTAATTRAPGTDVQPNDGFTPVAFEQLPFSDAIRTVHGNGQRRFAVFSDPGCSFCRRLEQELDGMNNVTIHTFLVPFQGKARPVAIWCTADREQAWRSYMLQGDTSPLNPAGGCDHPLDRNLTLARRLGVQGTPTVFWADGTRTEGYVDRSMLEARLTQIAQGRP